MAELAELVACVEAVDALAAELVADVAASDALVVATVACATEVSLLAEDAVALKAD